MVRKNIFVIYNEDDWHDAIPLKSSPETRISFEEFYNFAALQGVDIFRAHIDWYDPATGLFHKAWAFQQDEWKKVTHPPKPTAIFDKVAGKYDYTLFEKKMAIVDRIPLINSPTFRTLFDNKLNQFLIFEPWMPISFLAENQIQFETVLNQVKSSRAVVKLLYGSGGKEVTIGEKTVLSKQPFSFPVIVQEFIPTAGIPGFSPAEEIADLRLVFINHQLVYALSRIAKPGSLFTNFHQGATAVLVPEEKIPKNCLTVATEIQKKLRRFEKTHYSLDFMFSTKGEPVFIEMNTTPGFDLLRLVATKEIWEQHAKKLLSLFF